MVGGEGTHRSGTCSVFKSSSKGSRISLICSHENEVSFETNLSRRQVHIDSFELWGGGNENVSTWTWWVRKWCRLWWPQLVLGGQWNLVQLEGTRAGEGNFYRSEKEGSTMMEWQKRGCPGAWVRPQWASSLSNTTWGGRRGESVGGSITVGVPFKGLKAKHLYCKTNTVQPMHQAHVHLYVHQGSWNFPEGACANWWSGQQGETRLFLHLPGYFEGIHSLPTGLGTKLNSWLNAFPSHLKIQERKVAGWGGVMGCIFTLSCANSTSERGFQDQQQRRGWSRRLRVKQAQELDNKKREQPWNARAHVAVASEFSEAIGCLPRATNPLPTDLIWGPEYKEKS